MFKIGYIYLILFTLKRFFRCDVWKFPLNRMDGDDDSIDLNKNLIQYKNIESHP